MTSPNQLACEEAIALLSRPKGLQFQAVADLGQLRQLWEIDKEAYQDQSLSLERFQDWWERYEFGSRILLDGDRILASIGIYPLSESRFNAFTTGRIPERDLMPVAQAECDETSQQFWYASGIVTAEEVRGWGSPLKTLLQMGFHSWMNSGHIAYPMTLMAIAEYEIGARLLTFFGFTKLRDGVTLPDGCDLYQITFDSERHLQQHLKARGL